MWRHQYAIQTDLPVDALWPVLANIAGWPAIDKNIESLVLDGPPASGTTFMLQPRGGPKLRFTIGTFRAPNSYSDICHLFGASMTTAHHLDLLPNGSTRIGITIEITGILSWFWARAVGKRHADGLAEQTRRFVAAGREQLKLVTSH